MRKGFSFGLNWLFVSTIVWFKSILFPMETAATPGLWQTLSFATTDSQWFTGEAQILDHGGDVRKEYIEALREADKQSFERLIRFACSKSH